MREFVDADFLDEMHAAIAPIGFGHQTSLRLWAEDLGAVTT